MRDDLVSGRHDSTPHPYDVAVMVEQPIETPTMAPSDDSRGAEPARVGLRSAARALIWPDTTRAPLWVAERWREALVALTLITLCVTLAPIQPGDSTWLQAGAQARADYRYDLALSDNAQAHDADPSDPRPLCANGDVYTLQRLLQQAASAYRACAALAPSDGSAWLRLGDALAKAGDDAGSVSAWKQAGKAHDYAGYARLATRAEGLSQFGEATRWWSQVPQDDETAQGHLGLLALSQGNAALASAHFFSLRASESAYAASLRKAGIFVLAGRVPTTARDEVDIGYALLTLDEPTLALAPLRRATQLSPTDGSAHAYFGWTLWLLGQRAAGRPEIAAGMRYGSYLPFAQYAAGQVALADGKYALALARFQTALEVDTRNPALWSAAGDAALAQQDYLTARLSYANAAQYSNDPAYTIVLAHFYFDHGIGLTDGTATQALTDGLRRFPRNEPLVFLEARIYDSLGQQTDAYYLYQRANLLDPTDPGPWLYLGRYEAAEGDVVPAIVSLRTAVALQPRGASAASARQALSRLSGYGL